MLQFWVSDILETCGRGAKDLMFIGPYIIVIVEE